MKQKKFRYVVGTMLAFSLFASACGNENGDTTTETEEQTQNTEENAENTNTERTVTDALGHEVTIPADPQKVIASYLEDYLVALGITPAAQWSVGDGATVQGYLQDSLADVPTIPYDLPLETVTSFQPDLIIMDSADMVEGTKYDQYNKIAPTFVVGTAQNNDWREELKIIGEVFGKENEATKVLEDYEQKVDALKAELDTAIGDESVAAIWLVGGTFYVVNDALSSGDVLYNDLGITLPNVVQEISNSSTANWSEISLEKLAELDADHIFLLNSDGNGAEKLSDPIWQNIPAVKNGNIYEYGAADTSWLYTGPVANTKMLEEIQASLIK